MHNDQPTLFAFDGNTPTAFADPAFARNKSAPLHRWVPWIAGFSRDFVQGAFARHLPQPGTVLDPFAGVGTTLVEAVLAGHAAIGFEINPYAALVCQTKLTAYQLGSELLVQATEALHAFYRRAVADDTYVPHSTAPPRFKSRVAFYSPEVLRKVLIVHDFMATLTDPTLRNVFRLAFASTMVRYSNYSYEPSLGTRVAAGKEGITDFPVGETIVAKLEDMAHDIRWMTAQVTEPTPPAQVFHDTFFHCQQRLAPASVDLLVTSPPYLNNYHYNRNTRPHLYWLGFATRPEDFQPLATQNFGTFWQTAREKACVELDPRIAVCAIHQEIAHLRTKTPEKGIYGGNGWANYAASYFNDCYRFAEGAHYALKKGGTALVVIGNSILQGMMIPTDQYLATIAEGVGLKLVDIHIPRSTRVGNSIIQSAVRVEKAKASHQLYEAVVELQKV